MIEIFVLSFIQGVTEFLPISSSGHLIFVPSLLGWHPHSLEIDGVVHLGTLFAVLVYFFSDIQAMVTAFLRTYIFKNPSIHDASFARLGLTIIVATLPVVIAGFALKRIGVDVLRTPFIIALASMIGGALLYLADRSSKTVYTLHQMTFTRAFMIGCAQILALIPGASRSGMCMVGGRVLGFDKTSATRYAFLLSIPSILGAFCLIFWDACALGIQTPFVHLGLYFALSFLFGLASIHFMLKFLQQHGFLVFAVYRVLLGLGILFFF